MKINSILMSLLIFALLSGCEDIHVKETRRMEGKVITLHKSAVKDLVDFEQAFIKDLDVQDQLHSKLKRDMEICRKIEEQLKSENISTSVIDLEKQTSEILVLIGNQYKKYDKYR